MKKQLKIIVAFWLFVVWTQAVQCAEPLSHWTPAGEDFSIDTIEPQRGWIAARKLEAGKWEPVAQPELAKTLERTSELKLTNVAPPPERCWVGHRPYVVPNPDGQSWDMAYPYYNTYGGEQEVVIHDFGTGHTRKQSLSGGKGDSVLTKERIDFHMQPAFYADGKLIFEMYGPVVFVIYDPAHDAFVEGVKPFGDDVINGRCVLGENGMIYGMGWPRDKSGFVAYRFDPKTCEATRFDTFGPPNEHRRELYRKVMMFGDWIYAAIGARPWHLVAFNVQTGKGRVLATTEPIIGDPNTIAMDRMKGGLSGHVRSAASVSGIDEFDEDEFRFWLHDGRMYPRVNEVPPWSDAPAQKNPPKSYNWDREFQVWPRNFEPPSPPPFIRKDAGAPDVSGQVELPYRIGDQEEWQTLRYTVKMYPGEVKLLSEVNDHILFATDSGYGQHVFYNPRTSEIKRIGGTLSPYSLGLFRDRLYVSGYPGSQLVEYGFSQPLGLKQEPPNPKRLGYPASDTHVPLGGTLGGADGRVYNGGTTVGRRRVGGGIGWYDTETAELGGMPLEGHRIFWMTTAADRRYIVLSSKCEAGGRLFVWDTQTHSFRHRVAPPEGATRPGPIAEALPDLVLGHTVNAEDKPLLYGFDPVSGVILWTKAVPSPPVTAFALVRRQAYAFRRGPNGFIWSFFDNTLVRIDPRDARVEAIGRLPNGTRPAQLGFVQDQLYMAGGDHVRRIEWPCSDRR
ncbi:MAG: hypothetical protein ACQESR_07780 [Planctomycetota bacterium]